MNPKKYLKGFAGELYSDYINHLYSKYQNQDPEMGARFIATINQEEKSLVNSKGKTITKEQRLSEDLEKLLRLAGYKMTSPYYVEACGLIFSFVQKTAVKFEKEIAIMGLFTPRDNNKEDNYERRNRHRS